jgi:hypothetical protein
VPSSMDIIDFASVHVLRLQRHLHGVNCMDKSGGGGGGTSKAEFRDIFRELDEDLFAAFSFCADGAEVWG